MNSKGSLPKHKVGDTVDRLTIIERAGSTPQKAAVWTCRCECGNITNVIGHTLGKSVKSCGCLRVETTRNARWNGIGDLSGSYWSGVVRNANSRAISIDLTMEQAWEIFQAQGGVCAISGLPITLLSDQRHNYYGTASLDRIDNSIGYTATNVHWVHKDINIMKKDHSMQHFVELCRAVATQQLTTPSSR